MTKCQCSIECTAIVKTSGRKYASGHNPNTHKPKLDPNLWNNSIPVPFSGCYIWMYKVAGPMKYGVVYVNGREVYAHRRAWELTYGPIPLGMQVLHRCDTPPCINPEHLFLGTQSDNMRDKVRKGRDHNVRKTSCPQGHPYDEANTIRFPSRPNGRYCHACNIEKARLYRKMKSMSRGKVN